MVGVPRSKGCRTCVSRRVRCDLNKPVCNNCKKGNRDCVFTDDIKFQDEGAKLRKRYAKKTASDKENSESPPFIIESFTASSSSESPESGQWSDVGQISDVAWSESSQWPSSTDISRASTPMGGSNIPNRNAFFSLLESNKFMLYDGEEMLDKYGTRDLSYPTMRQQTIHLKDTLQTFALNSILLSPGLAQEQLLSFFQSSLTPKNQLVSVPQPFRAHGRWLSYLPKLTGRNYLLDTAVRAVSLAHMGRLYGSEVFLNESRPYYGKAIRLLNSAISDQDKGMASETLSATMLLSFYEMFTSNSNDSWIKHAGGAGALMKMRGPQRHRYGFDREIFVACRHNVIIEAFHTDEPCFLNEPDWIQVSRDIYNDLIEGVENEDTLELFHLAETFYEEMLAIPALLFKAKNFRTAYKQEKGDFPSSQQFRQELIRRVVISRSNLKAFYARFEGCLMNLNYGWTSYVSDDPLITRFYTFPNVFVASTCTGYWTVLVIINFMLIELQRAASPGKENLYKIENKEFALEICRSTPYMLTSSFLGPFFCIFGLRVCLIAMETGEEREWVVSKLFEIGETHMAMASHIPGYAAGTGMPRVRSSLNQANKIENMEQAITNADFKPLGSGEYLGFNEGQDEL